jgi:hypothetical protein
MENGIVRKDSPFRGHDVVFRRRIRVLRKEGVEDGPFQGPHKFSSLEGNLNQRILKRAFFRTVAGRKWKVRK